MTLTDTIKWILDDREPIGDQHSEAALRAAAEALNDSLKGEYVFNDRITQQTHIVVNVNDFETVGDAATVCGAIARSATYGGAEYDICPDCIA